MNISRFILSLAASDWLNHQQRLWLYRQLGIQSGDAYVSSGCRFAYPELNNVYLGDRSFLNHDCLLENGEAIVIGDDSCIAPRVMLLTTTHNIGTHQRRVGNGCIRSPIIIGKGCWIGAGAIILPGVKLGDGCVIGAGSVVKYDCEPDGLYVGNPAYKSKTYSLTDPRPNDNHPTITLAPMHITN